MPTTNRPPELLPALIGGSGLYAMSGCGSARTLTIATPWQGEAINLQYYADHPQPFLFLPRHGQGHRLAPHQIPYRANLWALRQAGAACVLSFNAVGGIADALVPGALCLPDQIIDYTWGRDSTYYELSTTTSTTVPHLDFTEPYSGRLRQLVAAAATRLGLPLTPHGVYACTQGPRLETAAEIRRLQRDGCDMVGMTGMPEAILARELGLDYCSVALVVNRAAGLAGAELELAAMQRHMAQGKADFEALVRAALPVLAREFAAF